MERIVFWFSLFMILYTYFGYPLILLFLQLFIRRSEKEYFSGKLPKVSLIIAAYNEEKIIRQKIENSINLEYPKDKFEVIVCSDGSTDQTEKIVQEYEVKGLKLIAYKRREGKVNILNKSIPQADSEIVVLSDANTMYNEEAVKELVKHFSDLKIGCVCGELKLVEANGKNRGENIYWRYETFLRKLESRIGIILGANGGIYAIRKELFEPLHPKAIIDDFLIPMKVVLKGYRCVYEQRAIGVEEVAKSMADEFKRRARIGAGNFQSLIWLLSALNPLKGFLAFAFWSHKIIRWFVPFFLIFLFISNIFLLGNSIYNLLFMLQIGLYLMTIAGYIIDRFGYQIKPFAIFYYLVSMNLALFIGFWKCILGIQKAAWERTER